jgi:hypothetical protein
LILLQTGALRPRLARIEEQINRDEHIMDTLSNHAQIIKAKISGIEKHSIPGNYQLSVLTLLFSFAVGHVCFINLIVLFPTFLRY